MFRGNRFRNLFTAALGYLLATGLNREEAVARAQSSVGIGKTSGRYTKARGDKAIRKRRVLSAMAKESRKRNRGR